MTISDNITALTNTTISIDCPASGIPKPTITWRKDDQELSLGNGYLIHDNGTLVIKRASAGDRGRYSCSAGSTSGEDNSTSFVNVVGTYKLCRIFMKLKINLCIYKNGQGHDCMSYYVWSRRPMNNCI
jgi:hypothetical protein